jgi:hypothetical protein
MHLDRVEVHAVDSGKKKTRSAWVWAEERGAVVDDLGEP